MAALERVGVRAIVEGAAAYVADAKRVQQATGDIAGAAEHSSRRFNVFTSAAKAAALAVAGFGVAVVGAAIVGVKAASDLNESLNKGNEVFGESVKAVRDFAATSALAFGISKRAAFEYSATLGAILKASGLSQEAAAGMSVELTKLGADLASFNNISVDEALIALRAGLVGESEPLRRLGVLLNEDVTKRKAVALGIAKEKDELTDGQKVLARYALIMEQTATQQGDFARTSTGLANSQRILSARFEDLRAQIGQKLLPVAVIFFAKLLDGISLVERKVVPAVESVIKRFGALRHLFSLGLTGGRIGGEFSTLERAAFNAGQVFRNQIIPALQATAKFIKTDVIPAVKEFVAFVGPQLQKLGEIVRVEFQKFRVYYESDVRPALDNVITAVRAVIDYIAQHWPEIERVVRPVLQQVLLIITTALRTIGNIVAIFLDVLQGDWDGAWKNVKDIVDDAWRLIKGSVENGIELVKGVLSVAKTAISAAGRGLFDLVWDGITSGARAAANVVIDEINQIIRKINSLDVLGVVPDIPEIGRLGGGGGGRTSPVDIPGAGPDIPQGPVEIPGVPGGALPGLLSSSQWNRLTTALVSGEPLTASAVQPTAVAPASMVARPINIDASSTVNLAIQNADWGRVERVAVAAVQQALVEARVSAVRRGSGLLLGLG